MTTKCIVFNRNDGGITIRNLAPRARLADESEEAFIERMANKHPVKTGEVSRDVIEKVEVPTDYTYRDAWTFRGGKFDVDMPKARDIHRDRLRRERKPLMEALDVEFLRALESGADTKAIADEKQRLRDVTTLPAIDAAQTPDELKAIRARRQ